MVLFLDRFMGSRSFVLFFVFVSLCSSFVRAEWSLSSGLARSASSRQRNLERENSELELMKDGIGLACSSGCSGHGTCDFEQNKCICHSGWMGIDCSENYEIVLTYTPEAIIGVALGLACMLVGFVVSLQIRYAPCHRHRGKSKPKQLRLPLGDSEEHSKLFLRDHPENLEDPVPETTGYSHNTVSSKLRRGTNGQLML